MIHVPDCACGIFRSSTKGAVTTRRDFLCLALGGAALGVAGTASTAKAALSTDFAGAVSSPLGPTLANPDTAGTAGVLPAEKVKKDIAPNGTAISLPKYPDMHSHLRQGEPMRVFIERHIAMGSDIVVAMPNTAPPVSLVTGKATQEAWSIESYLEMIRLAGGDKLRDIIVPLYLTSHTTAEMIDAGAKSGLLRAVKFYPPNGTTNSGQGISLDSLLDSNVLQAMERNDIVLCLHGEQHGLIPEDYFDRDKNAETIFYREKMPRLVEKHPGLRISCEHVTTEEAVKFVQHCDDHVVGTVTPQHMLYTIGHLLQTWHADLFCRPLMKFESDRAALLGAVTDPNNRKFIAGTDSAPHPRVAKSTPCGCASGCYVGGIAPQLYAQAFESAGVNLSVPRGQASLRRFMAENAWRFWHLEPSREIIHLVKKPSDVTMITLPDGQQVEPLPVAMMTDSCDARSVTLPWSLEM